MGDRPSEFDSTNKSHSGNPSQPSSSEKEPASSGVSGSRPRLRQTKIIAALALLFVLLSVGVYLINRAPKHLPHASSEPDPMAEARDPAPGFDLNLKFERNRTDHFSSTEKRGDVVLVTFWSTECATCMLELQAFNELKKRYGSEGLEVVAVNLDSTAEGRKQAQELWKKNDYLYSSFFDGPLGSAPQAAVTDDDQPTDPDATNRTAGQTVAKRFKVETLPNNFVIDRRGRMAFTSSGTNDWLAPETARLIEDLLLEERP